MDKLKLVTHDGKFHPDEIFACAALFLVLKNEGKDIEVFRTRDEAIVSSGDYVFDVGGIYDPENNRFDHHQQGGAGKRQNGIEYASFGLVWKKYGEKLSGSEEVANEIDAKLVNPIDAHDNGIDLIKLNYPDVIPYSISSIFDAFMPTWKEDESKTTEIFLELVELAKNILKREIIRVKDNIEARALVEEAYKKSSDKRLVVLDGPYPWYEVISKYPDPLFVVLPRRDGKWNLNTVLLEKSSFKARKDLPKNWAGLLGEELQKVTGVSDAVFCHRALFLAVANSKEGILKMAELALNK